MVVSDCRYCSVLVLSKGQLEGLYSTEEELHTHVAGSLGPELGQTCMISNSETGLCSSIVSNGSEVAPEGAEGLFRDVGGAVFPLRRATATSRSRTFELEPGVESKLLTASCCLSLVSTIRARERRSLKLWS